MTGRSPSLCRGSGSGLAVAAIRARNASPGGAAAQQVLEDMTKKIERFASLHEKEGCIGRHRADKDPGEHGDGNAERVEFVERRDE